MSTSVQKKTTFAVCVWVPTKGWKRVHQTTDPQKAYAFATELEPLQVCIQARTSGSTYFRSYQGGCITEADCRNTLIRTLQKILEK